MTKFTIKMCFTNICNPKWLLLLWFQLCCWPAIAQFADEATIDPNSENPRLHGIGELIDSNYPVPTGAIFVSNTGNDVTGTGSQANPWQTINKAITAAASGATIVLREGNYRVGTVVTLNKKVTIQPFPHETIWIKGSIIVSDWVQETGQQVWRKDNWNYSFARLSQGSANVGACTQCIDARYPEADYRDMAFIDGISMQQVLTLGQVTAGKFYVDNTNHKVYIGNNPTGKTVELTSAERALSITADEVKILGLGFAHYADRAVHVNNGADFGTFENNTFVWNALEGLGCTGSNVIFKSNNFSYNGQLGMEAGRSNQSVFEKNTFKYNNVEFFRTGWAAAGIKLTDATGILFKNNLFEKNYAHCLWLDNGIRNATAVHNTFLNNSGQAILFEISNGAIIAGNLAVGNSVGISVSGSQNAQVYNNTLVNNGIPLVVNEYIRNDIAHLYNFRVENAVFKNNILFNATTVTNGALFSVARSDCAKKDLMVTELDYNAYYRSDVSKPVNMVRWNPVQNNCNGTFYPTIETFKADYPAFEAHSIVIDNNAANPFFINETTKDYRLKPGSAAINAGEPLPTAIAQALGWEEGVPVNMGAKLTYDGTTGDATAPSSPTGLISPTKSATSVSLSWTPASDNVSVSRYNIFTGTTLSGSTTAAQTSFTVNNLLPNQSYNFTITALDASGNESAPSSVLAITTNSDTEPPSAPANVVLLNASPASAVIRWSSAADNVQVTGYDIYNGTNLLGSVTQDTTFSIFRLVPATAYSIIVKARDAAGNRSDNGIPLAFTTPEGFATTVREDAYIREGSVTGGTQAEAGKNFGTLTTLLSKLATDGTRRDTYFKFDLPAGNRPIASASMLLYGSLATGGSSTLTAALYPLADNTWKENTLTWNNKPNPSATVLSTTTLSNTAAKYYQWDVTSYVRAQQQAGNSLLSLVLKHTSVSSNTSNWTAKEGGGFVPYLDITYYDLLTKSLSDTIYCTSANLNIPFTAVGTFANGNVFSAQLSDANGSFTNPLTIGSLTASAQGTQIMQATLPSNVTPGNGYRIRITGSNPAIQGKDNGTNLSITSLPSAQLSGNQAICAGDSALLHVAFQGSGPWTFSYTDGTTPVSVSGISTSSYTFKVRPDTASTYSLISVTNGKCTGTVGGTASVTLNSKPKITALNPIIVEAENCDASVSFEATATGVPVAMLQYFAEGAFITSPHVFPIGTTTVTIKADNTCGSDSSTFTVTVKDTQAPVVTTPSPIVFSSAPGKCGIDSAAALALLQVTDNCAQGIHVTNDAPAIFNTGSTTVTWTASDKAGNTTTVTQLVTVNDTEAPVVRTQNLTVQLNDQGLATITAAQINNGSSDNCGIKSLHLNTDSFDCNTVGTQKVALTVTDIHENTATDTAIVIIKDTQAPLVITQNLEVSLVNGIATITPSQINKGSNDNCAIQSLSINKTSFNCTNSGANQIILTATDIHGNTASNTATVTVKGNLPVPYITLSRANGEYTAAQPNIVYLGYGTQQLKLSASGGVNYNWSPATGLSNANIGNPIFTATVPGTFNYTVTATNEYGCSATASVRLEVIDVRCGNKLDKVLVCHNGESICISKNAVLAHLQNHQDHLGNCTTAPHSALSSVIENQHLPELKIPAFEIFPNPSYGNTTLRFKATKAGQGHIQIINTAGQIVMQTITEITVAEQLYEMQLNTHPLPAGTYSVRFTDAEHHVLTQGLIISK